LRLCKQTRLRRHQAWHALNRLSPKKQSTSVKKMQRRLKKDYMQQAFSYRQSVGLVSLFLEQFLSAVGHHISVYTGLL